MNNVLVLLIDADETPILDRAFNTGGLEQFCFTQTGTLSAGLRALQESRFHLVLLNLPLPDASTADSVKKILEKAGDLPVVALVNQNDTEKTARALRLGVDDYLTKDRHCDFLVHSMRQAIDRKQFLKQKDTAGDHGTKPDARLTAHLSHELRNALACIHQFGTIMIDGLAGTVSDEQREYLCIILENASRIRRVVDETLEGTVALSGK